MKRILLVVVFFAINVSLFAQKNDFQHELSLDAGSSFLGFNTNVWVSGSLVKQAYAIPVSVLSYTFKPEPNFGVGVAASYQLFYFDLLPINASSSAVVMNINRINVSAHAKYYFVSEQNFDVYAGGKLGGTFWFGKVSFQELYDYITVIAPDFLEPILQKRIIPSNLKFATSFFTGQLNLGGDIYFTDNVGLKLEMAVGAPYWALVGLNVRL
ncbi:MAG: hypothetical protein JXL97_08515 [Bacteroidales bacterium]|nr:hypothetical protein [Bacteroidales bacterium]